MRFQNQVIVVTGGAQGIGAACASLFHDEGASVAILDVNDAEGRALADRLGDRALYATCDVSDESAVISAVGAAEQAFGGVDLLVCAAGVQRYSNAVDTTEQEWDLVLGVNLKGCFFAAKHVIPSMRRRGRGVIVNVASVNAFHCQRNTLPYATSKAALLGLTRSIAADFAPQVRCVAVCPGTVDTPMLHHALDGFENAEAVMEEINRIALAGRVADPMEIAKLAAYLCSRDADFITGQAVRIDGGLGIVLGGTD